MPRDGTGAYTRLRRWTTDRTTGVPFSAERTDEDADDIATALDSLNDDVVALDTRVDVLEAAGTPASAVTATIVEAVAADPPGGPSNGAKYLVIATATGAWAGHEDRVATYSTSGSSWSYSDAPSAGSIVFAKDTRSAWLYDGVAWRREGPIRQSGTATFDAASSVAVTFTTEFANESYVVTPESPSNHTFWITNKMTSGFTLRCSGTISNTVKWIAEAL